MCAHSKPSPSVLKGKIRIKKVYSIATLRRGEKRVKFIRTRHIVPSARWEYWSLEGKRQAVRLAMMNGLQCHPNEFGFCLSKGLYLDLNNLFPSLLLGKGGGFGALQVQNWWQGKSRRGKGWPAKNCPGKKAGPLTRQCDRSLAASSSWLPSLRPCLGPPSRQASEGAGPRDATEEGASGNLARSLLSREQTKRAWSPGNHRWAAEEAGTGETYQTGVTNPAHPGPVRCIQGRSVGT